MTHFTVAGIIAAAMAANSAVPVPRVMASWFWGDAEFEQGGYIQFLEDVHRHSPVTVLTTSIRARKEVTDPSVREQINAAALHARGKGISIVMDLDVRLAREAFRRAHPDELQGMLRLREAELSTDKPARISIQSAELGDHYTAHNIPYLATAGRLLRVYAYARGDAGIEPETVEDITEQCKVDAASPERVTVALPADERFKGRRACVVAEFTHFCADVFAPHLLEFQREILKQYEATGIAGACKDEWGFPPCFDGCPEKNDFWYSRWMDAEYRTVSGGRDLVRDCLLMHAGERGRERERQAAVNRLMMMSLRRNSEVERDFYRAVKEVFGKQAYVCTHPTWYPVVDSREFTKNGLDWWQATRDFAQTDEVTPYCARTALSKKSGGRPWVNMFYSTKAEDYQREMWAACLAGGRVNYHPFYPKSPPACENRYGILEGAPMRGESRIRLLQYITDSTLDCPVAIVFGHACAMNWAGPHYDEAGVGLAEALWKAGYPADLIPSTEIDNGSLRAADDGRVQYGPQKYAAVVLYHPEFEGEKTAEFVKTIRADRTALYRVGEWTMDAEAKPYDGLGATPGCFELASSEDDAARTIIGKLKQAGVPPTSPEIGQPITMLGIRTLIPPAKGRSRLLDGTHIIASSEESAEGDHIAGEFDLEEHKVVVDAVGLVAVRLNEAGHVQALAAGGLKRFGCGDFEIKLDERLDLALWRDQHGRMRGVIQGLAIKVPEALTRLTNDWQRLVAPEEM